MGRTTATQRDANRQALISAGRAVFLECGFEAATNDRIAARAGLTRGALHHHFTDKRGLFDAVMTAEAATLSQGLYQAVMARADHGVDEAEVGARLLIDAFTRPEPRRLLLELGPAALGYPRWREILDPVTFDLVVHALGHWVEAGLLTPREVKPFATVLTGAALSAAIALADHGSDVSGEQLTAVLEDLVISLRARRSRSAAGHPGS